MFLCIFSHKCVIDCIIIHCYKYNILLCYVIIILIVKRKKHYEIFMFNVLNKFAEKYNDGKKLY